MHFKRLVVAVIGASCLAGSTVLAQDVAPVAPPAAAPVALAPIVIPKGTPIMVEIPDLVSTRTAQRDDMFNLKLAAPVMLDGVIIIPTGTPGKGQVIESAKPGMGGKPGKLVLAGRYLDFNGQQVPIRGLTMTVTAKNNANAAMATSAVVGIFGLAVTGGHMEVLPGTHATAKLSADFTLPAPVSAPQDTPPLTSQAN